MRIFKFLMILLGIVTFYSTMHAQVNLPKNPPVNPPATPPNAPPMGHPDIPKIHQEVPPQMSPDTILKQYGDTVRIKMSAGDYEGAFKYSDLRIKKTPFRLQYMYYDRAQAETYLSKYDNAIRDYDTVIGLDSSAAAAYMNQAYLYMQVHKTEKALIDYEKGLKVDKDSEMRAAIYLSRGNAYLSLKKETEAESDFSNTIAYNPKSWQAYLQRGSIKRFEHNDKDALADLNMAYKLKATDPDVLLLRGVIMYELELYRDCVIDLKEAIKVRKNNDTWFYLGMSEMKTGNDSMAREYLTRVIENDPKNVLVLNTRGKINFEMKHPDLAIRDYTKVIQLKPKSGEGYANRAYVYAQIGEHDKACVDLHKAASLGVKKAQEVLKKYCGN